VKQTAFLAVAAVTSIISLASNRAQACASSDISTAALGIIANNTASSSGAGFFSSSVQIAWTYTDDDVRSLWAPLVEDPNNPGTYSYGAITSPVLYDDIIGATYFTQINSRASIGAGDLLVIDATDDGYSGATAIVTGAPTAISPAKNPVVANTTQWAVPIADYTGSYHSCSGSLAATYPDSRCGSTGAKPGTGYLRLYVDSTTGAPAGHTWSVTSGGTYYPISGTGSRPLAIGRVTPSDPLHKVCP
jgi:hypothetical protein